MQKISPFLWFDHQAEEAANYYVATFTNSKILTVQRYPEAAVEVAGKPAGSVMTVEFEIGGLKFFALNGGPIEGFTFSPATSFAVDCETQEEIDRLWDALSADPEAEQCGWCKDKFGITWQIVPTVLTTYLGDANPEKVNRVTAAFMQMKKFDIATLKEAYEGK